MHDDFEVVVVRGVVWILGICGCWVLWVVVVVVVGEKVVGGRVWEKKDEDKGGRERKRTRRGIRDGIF